MTTLKSLMSFASGEEREAKNEGGKMGDDDDVDKTYYVY